MIIKPKLEYPQEISINRYSDDRGILSYLELPFDAKRFYMISQFTGSRPRGQHAHKNLTQFLFCSSGAFSIELISPLKKWEYRLTPDSVGLLIPPGYWRNLSNFTSDGVCVVLASSVYEESDYIRDFFEYQEWFKEAFADES